MGERTLVSNARAWRYLQGTVECGSATLSATDRGLGRADASHFTERRDLGCADAAFSTGIRGFGCADGASCVQDRGFGCAARMLSQGIAVSDAWTRRYLQRVVASDARK